MRIGRHSKNDQIRNKNILNKNIKMLKEIKETVGYKIIAK